MPAADTNTASTAAAGNTVWVAAMQMLADGICQSRPAADAVDSAASMLLADCPQACMYRIAVKKNALVLVAAVLVV